MSADKRAVEALRDAGRGLAAVLEELRQHAPDRVDGVLGAWARANVRYHKRVPETLLSTLTHHAYLRASPAGGPEYPGLKEIALQAGEALGWGRAELENQNDDALAELKSIAAMLVDDAQEVVDDFILAQRRLARVEQMLGRGERGGDLTCPHCDAPAGTPS